MKVIALLVCFAATLAAADVTGTWRGTITSEMARETTGGDIPAYMDLRQTDANVTGSAGPDETKLYKIREGKVNGDKLIVEASPREGTVLRFILVLKGNVLSGDVEEDGRLIGTAKLTKER